MNKFEQALAIKFLKSKRILTNFKKRVEKYHGVSLEEINRDLGYKNMIWSAFIWSNQPEGYTHWEYVQEEYIKFMEEELSKVKEMKVKAKESKRA